MSPSANNAVQRVRVTSGVKEQTLEPSFPHTHNILMLLIIIIIIIIIMIIRIVHFMTFEWQLLLNHQMCISACHYLVSHSPIHFLKSDGDFDLDLDLDLDLHLDLNLDLDLDP